MNKGKLILSGSIGLAVIALLIAANNDNTSTPRHSRECDSYTNEKHKPAFIVLEEGMCSDEWPLTVKKVRIMCNEGQLTATVLDGSYKMYGVNGTAISAGHTSIREIVKDGASPHSIVRTDICP